MLRKNAQINTTAWTQPCISMSLNNMQVLPTWGGGSPSPHDPAAPLFPSATSCARAGRGCSAGRRPREGTERMRILGRCCRLRLPRHLRGLYLQSKRSPFPTVLKIRVQQAEARNRVRIEILQMSLPGSDFFHPGIFSFHPKCWHLTQASWIRSFSESLGVLLSCSSAGLRGSILVSVS